MNFHKDADGDSDAIDQDNRARTERLALKLARLKNVAVDIEEETRDHIPMLGAVDDSYERTLSAIQAGQNRLMRMIRSNRKGRHLFCYTVIFFFICMMLIYYWLSSDSTSTTTIT